MGGVVLVFPQKFIEFGLKPTSPRKVGSQVFPEKRGKIFAKRENIQKISVRHAQLLRRVLCLLLIQKINERHLKPLFNPRS